MKRIFGALLFFAALSTEAAPIKLTGFGLGLLVGNPTALSFKGYLGNDRYFDVAAAYNSVPADGLYLHGDYILEQQDVFDIGGELFNLYYGGGGHAFQEDSTKHKKEWHIGPRALIGTNYYLKNPAIEFFGEVAVGLDLTPETDLTLYLDIGARYWF